VIPFSIGVATQTDWMFGHLTSDPEVQALGSSYLQIRLYAAVFLPCHFSFRGYWNGIGLSMVYLRTIVVIHVCNVILNYLLIYGKFGFPELGVDGAALASAIATGIGTLTYLVLAWRISRPVGFLSKRAAPTRESFRGLVKLSIPGGIQGLFFAAGFMAFYVIAEQLGTQELAVTSVLINLAMVCVLPAMGFGLAAATLVGKSLGRREIDEAFAWGWTTVGLASAVLGVVGVCLALGAPLWLDLLMNDPPAQAMAVLPLILLGLTQPVDSIGVVLTNAMIGAGYVKAVMVVSLALQWGIFLPLCYVWGVHYEGGLLVLWIAMGIWRGLLAATMYLLFKRGGWSRVMV